MNFLAHLYLSGDSPKIRVGNFIGDFVKGKNLTDRFDTDIAKGIALHREIDWFTDRHSVVDQSTDIIQVWSLIFSMITFWRRTGKSIPRIFFPTTQKNVILLFNSMMLF